MTTTPDPPTRWDPFRQYAEERVAAANAARRRLFGTPDPDTDPSTTTTEENTP